MELTADFTPIAVIGYGCVFPPNSYDAEGFWDAIMHGRSGIAEPQASRWDWQLYYDQDRSVQDRTYCRLGGFVRDYAFPLQRHQLAPEAIAGLSRTQQLILDSSLQALAMTRYRELSALRSGLFVGNMLGDEALSDYSLRLRTDEVAHYISHSATFAGLDEETRSALLEKLPAAVAARVGSSLEYASALLPAGLASVVAQQLGIQGPALLADGACASGLMIVDVATRYLADRSLDVVVASGVMANMAVTGNVCFAKIGGLSPTGSHPLDVNADGLVPGEGVGTVVLKRLDDAIADGDTVHGVIRGIATRCDGKGKAIYAPSSRGQVSAMRHALAVGGLTADELDHIETHATATPTGDGVELESIRQLFDEIGGATVEISVGSVKSLIGHTFPAAGMANLIKVLLSFEHETLPPVHGITTAQPILDDPATPFRVRTHATYWGSRPMTPRRAAANAFGFGGVNTSICVEQGIQAPSRERVAPAPTQLAVLGVGAVLPGADTFTALQPSDGTPLLPFPLRWGEGAAAAFDPDGSWRAATVEKWQFPWRQLRVPPNTIADIDRAQQLALVAADEALRHAFSDAASWRDAGVFIGASAGLETGLTRNLRIRAVEYAQALRDTAEFARLTADTQEALIGAIDAGIHSYIGVTNENALPGYMDNIIAGRIGNMLDLRGTNMVIDDGASSFASALDVAARHLAQGDCPVALIGAVHANLTPEYVRAFTELLGADFVPGEGAVMLVVCPVQAVPEGATVHAVLSAPSMISGKPVLSAEQPFYFGAQGAVEVAYAIRTGTATTVNTYTGTAGDRGYRVEVGIPGVVAAPSQSADAGEALSGEVQPEGVQPAGQLSVAASPEPSSPQKVVAEAVSAPGALYLHADTIDELLAQLDSSTPAPERGRYCLAVTYRDIADLERKKVLLRTSLKVD